MDNGNERLDRSVDADPDNLDYVIPDGLRSNISLQEYSNSNIEFYKSEGPNSISGQNIVSELQESLFSSFKSTRLSEVLTNQQFAQLTTAKQIEIIAEHIPTFKEKWSLFPIFSWNKNTGFSITYRLYFQTFKLAILKCLIFFILAAILWMFDLLLGLESLAFFWISFGTAFLGLLLLKIFEKKTERMILDDANKEEQGWTQNRFAVLFENLDVGGSKLQFKAFLDQILIEKQIQGKIIDIMFLQDCKDFGKIREKYFNVEHSVRKQLQLSESLLQVNQGYQRKKELYEKFALYRGKAIVIFETIYMRDEIYKHFQYSWFKSMYFCCCCCCSDTRLYKFISKFPRVSKLPEPDDIAFESLHYSRKWIYFVELLVYSIGLSMVGGGIVGIIFLKVKSLDDQPIPHIFTSGICVSINICLNVFGDLLFGNMIRTKKSSLDYERLTFFKRLNFLNFNVYLCVLMLNLGIDSFNNSLYITSAILVLSIPTVKVIIVLFKELIRQFKLKRLANQKEILSKYTKEEICKIVSKQHFDFPSAVGDLSAYMFICAGFYYIALLPLVLLVAFSLLLNIIVDKWLILNYTAPVQIVSPNQGLNFFSLLKWDIRVTLLPLAFAGILFNQEGFPEPLEVMLLIFFGISMAVPLSVGLHEQYKREWGDYRKFVKYEDVVMNFKDTFQKRYPLDVY